MRQLGQLLPSLPGRSCVPHSLQVRLVITTGNRGTRRGSFLQSKPTLALIGPLSKPHAEVTATLVLTQSQHLNKISDFAVDFRFMRHGAADFAPQ